MLSRIVHNSPQFCAFARPLLSSLSEPQGRHFLNLADALLVCEDKKTMAALQRQFIESVDVSNWADFLRISPWNASEVRAQIRKAQIAWAIEQAEAAGEPKEIFINIDDSIGEKGAQTWRLEPVDWFHDHKESTPRRHAHRWGLPSSHARRATPPPDFRPLPRTTKRSRVPPARRHDGARTACPTFCRHRMNVRSSRHNQTFPSRF
ncbi:MAG: hypothetical protein ACREEM_50505 [Blastocatellia bacterium]